jgi:hypothetical protein
MLLRILETIKASRRKLMVLPKVQGTQTGNETNGTLQNPKDFGYSLEEIQTEIRSLVRHKIQEWLSNKIPS